MNDLLLKHIYYLRVSSDRPPLRGYDLLIEDGKVKEIGKDLSAGEGVRVIDCSQHVVVPGFVNTHHHFYQTLTRNIPAVQDAKLFDWLVYLYDVWKHISEDGIYYSSLLAMGELLKTGCTTSTDHHYLYPQNLTADIMEMQFSAADRLGMRFSPTRGSMSRSRKDGGLPPDSVVQTERQILEDSLRVIQRFHDSSPDAMHKIVLAPCSPFSVTKDLMKESAAMAREYGVSLHTHLAETYDENDFCVEVYGKRPLALMEECDFLGDDVFFAHGIHFNDAELEVLKQTHTHIAHCPSSNMRLGSGICRVKEMLPMGINIGIGVDGSASNDSSDFLGEMRNTLLLQRVHYGADAITADEVFTMASENGAELLHFDGVGTLKEGFAADAAIFDISSFEYAGSLSDPLASLIFTGYDHGTAYTIVQGKVVVDDGRLVGVDEEELASRANELSAVMLDKSKNEQEDV